MTEIQVESISVNRMWSLIALEGWYYGKGVNAREKPKMLMKSQSKDK